MNNSTWTDQEGVPAGYVKGQPTREWANAREPSTHFIGLALSDLHRRIWDKIDKARGWAPALSEKLACLDKIMEST